MMLKIEAIIWRTALDSLEIELERKLTESQRQIILLEIRKIILSFIQERYILDILILRPFDVIRAFYRFADDEILHKKDVKKPSLNMWKRFVHETVKYPEMLEWYL